MRFLSGAVAALIGILFLATGCTVSPDQIKQVVKAHPEIVIDVIKDHPAEFMETLQKASVEARQKMAEKEEKEFQDQLQAEMKNPHPVEIPAGRALRGSKDAPILIVEYSDFQCPYCRKGFETVEGLRKKYGDKIAFVFRNLPLPFHPLAMPAAKRFEAIALQSPEKAYRYHDEVFSHQDKLSADGEKFLDAAAKKAGADMAKMKKDMDGPQVAARIAADQQEAGKLGFQGTPGFLVSGVVLKGAYPTNIFENIIDTRLKGSSGGSTAPEAQKSGSGK